MAKVALITGCSSGLGAALARALHAQGQEPDKPKFRVFASARKLEALNTLRELGIECVRLDVTSDESVKEAVAQVIQAAGRIDLLINNAGVMRIGPTTEQPISQMQEMFDANVWGPTRVVQAVAPHMIKARSGLIVMVGSAVSYMATPFGGTYSASKAALLSMTDGLRLELAPFGIGVTYSMTGGIKSSLCSNSESTSGVEVYNSPSSAYQPFADGIKRRLSIEEQKDPKVAMPPEKVAAQVLSVVNAYFKSGGKKAPPTWFLAGGNACQYWLLGLAQKLFGKDKALAKYYGVDKKLPSPV